MKARWWMAMGLAAVAMAACSPTLDWRQVRPEGARLEALFPCKPVGHARRLVLAGAETQMSLFACKSGDSTYAVSFADVHEPARVAPALAQLQQAAAANVQGRVEKRSPAVVPGMTPNPKAERLWLDGRLPDGRPAHQETAVFAHATRVYQASIVSPVALEAEAVDPFFSGLRLSP